MTFMCIAGCIACCVAGGAIAAAITRYIEGKSVEELKKALTKAKKSCDELGESYQKGFDTYMKGLETLDASRRQYNKAVKELEAYKNQMEQS